MGTVTKWRQTEEAAAKLELLLRQIEHCFCDKVGWWQLSKKEEMATNATSPFSPTASDKVDTSSYSTPSQKKIDTSLSKMERRTSGSQLLSPTATTEQVYQHLDLAWPPIRKLRLSEGSALAKARLTGVNFEVSPSQPVTPGQGNSCMFHALLDQLRFQQASLSSIAVSHSQLRGKLVQAAYNSIKAGKLTWPEGESLEEWRSGMAQEGTMGDQVILQAAANLFQRQIVILPVFWSAAHLPSLGITLISPSSKTSKSPTKTSTSSSDALFVQYYSESRSSMYACAQPSFLLLHSLPLQLLYPPLLLPPSFKCISFTLVLLLNVFSILLLPSLFPLLVKQLHQLRVHAPSGEGSPRAWPPDKNLRRTTRCHIIINRVSIQQ